MKEVVELDSKPMAEANLKLYSDTMAIHMTREMLQLQMLRLQFLKKKLEQCV